MAKQAGGLSDHPLLGHCLPGRSHETVPPRNRLSDQRASGAKRGVMQISLIFSGFWLLPLGFLVYRSGFLPKTLGVLLMLGAPFYIAPFVGAVLGVDYPKTIVSQVIGFASGLPGTVGELALGFWLVIRGAQGTRKAKA